MQQGLWMMGEPQAVRDPLPPIWDTLYLCKSYVGLPFLHPVLGPQLPSYPLAGMQQTWGAVYSEGLGPGRNGMTRC